MNQKIDISIKDFLSKNKQFSDIKILVIGDVMIDHYIYGHVDRISPEAPVPVVLKDRESFYLGGAGNVFFNINSLSGKCDIASVVGDDLYAEYVEDLVKTESLNSIIIKDPARRTTIKKRIMSGQYQLLRLDEESIQNLNPEIQDAFIKKIIPILSNYNCVVLSDYNKGVLTPQVIRAVITECKKLEIPVIADPKQKYLDFYSGCTILKPNFEEFCNLCERTISPENLDLIKELSEETRKKLRLESIVITMSDRGIFYLDEKQSFMSEGYKIQVSDVSGAGDTVLAILALSYSSGIDKEIMIDLCNAAGSIACQKIGVVSLTLEDLNSHPKLREKYLTPVRLFWD